MAARGRVAGGGPSRSSPARPGEAATRSRASTVTRVWTRAAAREREPVPKEGAAEGEEGEAGGSRFTGGRCPGGGGFGVPGRPRPGGGEAGGGAGSVVARRGCDAGPRGGGRRPLPGGSAT